MLGLLALNPLGSVDIIFFVVIGALIALAVAIYFLIPVFNKKQYKEQRENLKKRETSFKANIQRTDGMVTEPTQEPTSNVETKSDDGSAE